MPPISFQTSIELLAPLERIRQGPQVEPEEVDFFRDVVPAAWRRESLVGAFLAREEGMPEWGVQDAEFDPFDDIEGYERWATAFVDADTPEEVAAVKRQIDREQEDERTLAAGGALGMVAAMAAGLVDPIVLLPVGGTALAGKGLGVLRRGLLTAQAGLVGASASEAALQSLQETRTWGESATNVAAATFLSGVLGSSVGLLPSELRARALREIEADLGEGRLGGGVGAEDVGQAAAERLEVDLAAPARENEVRLKGALGAEKLTARLRLSPSTEVLVRSESRAAREAVVELVDVAPRLTSEGEGIATPISVESDKLAWRAQEGMGILRLKELWSQHRLGRAGTAPERLKLRASDALRRRGDLEMLRALRDGETPQLTWKQFRTEVGRAMSRGDEHAIPEVAEAARWYRENVYEPLRDVLVRQGRLPEGFTPRGAISYLMRDYNVRKIARRENDFRAILRQDFQMREPDLSFEDADLIAEQVIQTLQGVHGNRLLHEPVKTGRGSATKERRLLVEDRLIEDFLERDIVAVTHKYLRTVVPDTLLVDKFGDISMSARLKQVVDEYQGLIKEAKSEAARERLVKRRDRDLDLLSAMRDRIRGVNDPPKDPDGPLTRTGRVVRNLNVPVIGGGLVLSAIPDLARFTMVHGMTRSFRHAFLPLLTDLKGLKLSLRETRLAGEALDLVLDSRAELIHDIVDDYGRHTKFERATTALAKGHGVVSGLAPWNQGMKTLAGAVIQTRIGQLAQKVAKGAAISKKDVEALAHLGLDEAMLRRIAAQPWEQRRSLMLADSPAWTDAGAIRAYRAAVRKSVNETIVTPGQGDLPRLVTSGMGRVIGQFKSFSFASVNRTFLPLLQQRDAAALSGIVMATGLGAAVSALKLKIAGRDEELAGWTTERFIAEGVDRSGVLGFYADMVNMVDTATRGTIGPRALVGGPRLSRYAVQGRVGALLGPTVSQAERLVQVSGAIFSGEVSQGDLRALRRITPYQNLFYVSRLFDMAEEAAADAFGVPRTSR